MEEKNTMFEGNLSAQEMSNMTQALKNPEFRKLLAEYCNEMSDPKNQALYEQELTQYEAERGVDLTFITPEPGFVIKTTVDGREKAFINVSRNDKVDRPTSQYGCDSATGRRGLQWSIPLTQAPPRRDYDKKKQSCTVYDVVFHTDSLHLASRNHEFRQLVVNTACDAVESAFQVRLDRANVKFPKMTFKGTPRPTVIRKKIDKRSSGSRSSPSSNRGSSSCSSAGEEQFYPKVDMDNLNGDRKPIVIESKTATVLVVPEYTVPKYKLVHRRGVDMHEVTQERDAKLNVTLPQELIATVNLPLLSSSKHVKLDVRERTMDLVCDLPGAKYKLNLRLPHGVLEDQGTAKFDSSTRQLVVRMPVNRAATDLHLADLTKSPLTKQTSDSGVDSPSSHSHSSDEEISSSHEETSALIGSGFLDGSTGYTIPPFSTNVLDNDVVFTLNVKNVDPASVEVRRESNWLHLKFYSIGSGYAPSHFAFFLRFLGGCRILGDSVEPWDNNVVVQVNLSAGTAEYEYGLDRDGELERGYLRTKSSNEKTEVERKTTTNSTTKEISETSSRAFEVRVREGTPRTVMIELSEVPEKEGVDAETEEDVFGKENVPVSPPTTTTAAKCNKKNKPASKGKNEKKQKQRSLSESNCEDLKEQQKEAVKLKIEKCAVSGEARNLANCGVGGIRKARSISESGCDIMDPNGNLFHFKSILKRRQLNRSVSESCSSASDDQPLGVSFDMGVGSFGDIPEEEDSDQPNGSCKKSVTFNDVIRKQLFR